MSSTLLRYPAQHLSRTQLRHRFASANLKPRFTSSTPSASTPPPVPPPPPPPPPHALHGPKPRRPLLVLASGLALSLTAYTLGSLYPPSTLTLLFPRPAPGPPSDATSAASRAYTAALESTLQSLPRLQAHRARTSSPSTPLTASSERGDGARAQQGWYEVRPFTDFPEERRVNSLTSGALRGPGKLALPPLARVRRDERESEVYIHVGRGLCGHDGIVHGGMLATLLDETLARTAIVNLPEKVGVTARLTLNYRAPTRADQFIVIKTKLEDLQGRKAFVSGQVEDLDGNVLVEAEAMFVQPRYAKLLNTHAVKRAMGEPPESDEPVLLADGEKMRPKHAA